MVKQWSDIKKPFVSIGIQGLFMLMAGLEPARREAGDFLAALCCQSRSYVAVWTMSWPYRLAAGRWYIVSTHFRQMKLTVWLGVAPVGCPPN